MLDHEPLAELPGAAAPGPAAPGAGGGGGEPLDCDELLGAAEWTASATTGDIAAATGLTKGEAMELRYLARGIAHLRAIAVGRGKARRV